MKRERKLANNIVTSYRLILEKKIADMVSCFFVAFFGNLRKEGGDSMAKEIVIVQIEKGQTRNEAERLQNYYEKLKELKEKNDRDQKL